jgi:hypothetical protein
MEGIYLTSDLMNSILQDEKFLNEIADHVVQEYKKVLIELAYKANGLRLEDLLHQDPFAPGCWTVEQWKEFFKEIPPADKKPPKRKGLPPQQSKALLEEYERLKKILLELQNELACEESLQEPPVSSPLPESGSSGFSSKPKEEISRIYQNIVRILPKAGSKKLPERLRRIFSESQYLFRRELMVLYVLATLGFNSRIELELILGLAENVEARSHTIKKVVDAMISKDLIQGDILYLEHPFRTCLSIVQLTRKGTECCWDLEWDPCESEWERITRLKGDNNPRYTLSLLILALHARIRSHQVSILPEGDEFSGADIVLVGKDEQKYPTFVAAGSGMNFTAMEEVLTKAGRVAICGIDQEDRRMILGECKKKGIHPKQATDIESLVFSSKDRSRAIPIMKISSDSALWMEDHPIGECTQEIEAADGKNEGEKQE